MKQKKKPTDSYIIDAARAAAAAAPDLSVEAIREAASLLVKSNQSSKRPSKAA